MQSDFGSWEDAVTWLVEQPEHQELVRQCYFDRPVIGAARRYRDSAEWKEVTWRLPESSGRALDVGAGNGIVSYALAKTGWNVTALEPDPSHLVGAGAIRELCAAENLTIEVVEGFGESIPNPDSTFDLVMARQVAHHAKDLEKMFAEMARVLGPGGTLITFRDHVVDSEAGLAEFRNNHPLHRFYGGENAFRIAEYRTAIRNAGLEVDEELHQFDSAINYAPRSKDDLCRVISSPLMLRPLKDLGFRIAGQPFVFEPLMKLASWAYRKQGRLVSFVCRKPSR